MKRLLILLLLIPVFTWAQQTHTVGPKETLFSIGRDYNVHPRELAEYNNIPFGTGLSLGQVLKIPLKKTMAPLKPETTTAPSTTQQPVVANKPEKKVPVYHKVGKKENLFQISQRYNKVPIDDLKKWNNLSSDALKEGMDLIVGYKQSVEIVDIKKDEPLKPVSQQTSSIRTTPAATVSADTGRVNNFPTPQVKKVIVKTTRKDFNGGFFKSIYESQNKSSKEESGNAGVFKSTSGWEDGKYYCLHNSAPAGSVIKITNNTNQKSVYAKVLDVIPDLKENEGVLVRISNSAADELGASEANFAVTLQY